MLNTFLFATSQEGVPANVPTLDYRKTGVTLLSSVVGAAARQKT